MTFKALVTFSVLVISAAAISLLAGCAPDIRTGQDMAASTEESQPSAGPLAASAVSATESGPTAASSTTRPPYPPKFPVPIPPTRPKSPPRSMS